jgi:hypothetical protein
MHPADLERLHQALGDIECELGTAAAGGYHDWVINAMAVPYQKALREYRVALSTCCILLHLAPRVDCDVGHSRKISLTY